MLYLVHVFVFLLIIPLAAIAADDPKFKSQNALHETQLHEADHIFYDSNTGINKQILIGIVDKGSINTNHPELTGIIDSRSRASDNERNEGHGQFVTGILAAKSFNGEGIRGVMGSHAEVLFLGVDNSAEIGAAIRRLAENGASVINISLGVARNCARARLGSDSNSDCIHPCAANSEVAEAIRWAMHKKNTVVVISAGNDNDYIDDFGDISREGLIVVGSMNSQHGKSNYSNYGPGVTIFAPDFGIVSLSKDGYKTQPPATSFATPLVAGAARTCRCLSKIQSHSLHARDCAATYNAVS